MSDGFEDGPNAADLSSDYGFVGQDGWERAPGKGWEFEPVQPNSRIRLSWGDRLRIALRRITRR
jgi:hypothetical protein